MRSVFLTFVAAVSTLGAPLNDSALQAYFEKEVEKISSRNFTGIDSKEAWEKERTKLRAQLFEMMGLSPLPERGDLRAVVTGKVEREDFLVEKIQFQSSPRFYVTANLYLPKKIEKPLPTILYVSGHGPVKIDGVSYGNKVSYQHHGAWFARNGYACLVLDTVQMGEIEGIHHGTYREGMWWWNSRGYSSAGAEAWNCIRALDYLETRPEIDKTRFGVTGRSGGGAYSWWISSLDERIKAAAPVAGITDLRDHVVDGVVEGHCDCMYFVNTYRWDYPLVPALVAPRALLIANSDKDSIFPLDGVVRIHEQVAKIYELYGAEKNLGLLITEGPHTDTQDLQVPVFRWFNRHLKGEDPLIEMAAKPFFTPQELKVFAKLPEDQITSRIHETFVPMARPGTDANAKRKEEVRAILKEKSFAGWPTEKVSFRIERKPWGDRFSQVEFDSQEGIRLSLYSEPAKEAKEVFVTVEEEGIRPEEIVARLQREHGASKQGTVNAVLTVRGAGEKTREVDRNGVQTKRRYMLVGQTLDGMRVWDILRGMGLIRGEFGGAPIVAGGMGKQQRNLLMAKLFDPGIELVETGDPGDEPDYLNFLRFTSWEEVRNLASMDQALSK